jgi:hypothetical protein
MPIDYKKYAKNFKTELRPAVLKRANNKCEACGLENGDIVKKGRFQKATETDLKNLEKIKGKFVNLIQALKSLDLAKVVLTTAHLDHNIENNDLSNLKCLCQRCHLNYDKNDNWNRRKYGKDYAKNQNKIF